MVLNIVPSSVLSSFLLEIVILPVVPPVKFPPESVSVCITNNLPKISYYTEKSRMIINELSSNLY